MKLYEYGRDKISVTDERVISDTLAEVDLAFVGKSGRSLKVSLAMNPNNRWQIDSWERVTRDPRGEILERGEVFYGEPIGKLRYVERVNASSRTAKDGIFKTRSAQLVPPSECTMSNREFTLQHYGVPSPSPTWVQTLGNTLNRSWVWALVISLVCIVLAVLLRRPQSNGRCMA
jgi:hypothetical protein